MTKLVVEDWHASIRKILKGLEKGLKALRKSLNRCWINYLLQRLNDLNLLVARLRVTLHSVQNAQL